jgi:DNA-binding NarL/FixJ family response regulator
LTAEGKPKLRLLLAIYTRELKTAFFLALSDEPAVQIVATATNTAELLSYSRTFQPDVIVLEWELPGRPPVEVFPTLTQTGPSAKIFIISKPSSHQQIQDIASTTDILVDPADLINALEAFKPPGVNKTAQS